MHIYKLKLFTHNGEPWYSKPYDTIGAAKRALKTGSIGNYGRDTTARVVEFKITENPTREFARVDGKWEEVK